MWAKIFRFRLWMASRSRSNVLSTENGLGLLTIPSTEGGVPDFVGSFIFLTYLLNSGKIAERFSISQFASGSLLKNHFMSQPTVKQVLKQSRFQKCKAEITIKRHCQAKSLAVFAGHQSSVQGEMQ